VGKPTGKLSLGRYSRKKADSFTMDLHEMKFKDVIN
jgi:hypothetical protein